MSSSETSRVSIGEAARRLGITVETLRRWADAGQVPSSRTVGGQRRFLVADLDALTVSADAKQAS